MYKFIIILYIEANKVIKMFKSLIIFISFALMSCWADSTTPVAPIKCDVQCEVANAFFADKTNPHIFYECSHNRCVGAFTCPSDTVFSNQNQVCVKGTGVILPCKAPNGTFEYPGNPHKYIECFENRGYERVCPSDLVFDEKSSQCIFNDNGLTWPTDPPTTPIAVVTIAPTAAPTTAPPAPVTTAAPVATTAAPVATTAAPVATTPGAVACNYKGFKPDPNDKAKYKICKNGVEEIIPCPSGFTFDAEIGSCATN